MNTSNSDGLHPSSDSEEQGTLKKRGEPWTKRAKAHGQRWMFQIEAWTAGTKDSGLVQFRWVWFLCYPTYGCQFGTKTSF